MGVFFLSVSYHKDKPDKYKINDVSILLPDACSLSLIEYSAPVLLLFPVHLSFVSHISEWRHRRLWNR